MYSALQKQNSVLFQRAKHRETDVCSRFSSSRCQPRKEDCGEGGGPVPNPPGFGCKRGISGAVQAVCTQKRFQTPRFQLTPGGAGPGARAGMAEAAISVDAEIIALGLKESRLKSLPKLQLKKKVAVPVYTSAK